MIEALGSIVMFLGGFGLFMYGVHTTSAGLQKFAANRLKETLQSLTKKRFMGVVFGIVLTVAFQSSAATTVLVVEFVNAGMMNLAQALGIVLGSAVGTSIAIQLIAFQMLDIALGLIFIGFILYLLVGKAPWKYLGQTLIGFGIIFVGMANMSEATAPLKDIPQVANLLGGLGQHPILGILVGLGLTALLQSSPAFFAIMMSLAAQHLLTLDAIVPLVLGSHIGGTMTTLFSSIAATKMDAKRTAIANTGYKVVGTIIMLPFLSEFAKLVEWTTNDVQRQVANTHLLFALFMVALFLPFNSLIAKGLKRWIPDRPEPGPRLQFKFISEASLEVPTVAIAQAQQEIWALGKFIEQKMLKALPGVLLTKTDEAAEQVDQAEQDVDWYYRHTSRFLIALSKKGLTDEQTEDHINAQFILKELEYVGDDLMMSAQLVQKLHRENLTLSQRDWVQLNNLYDQVSNNFATMLAALKTWDANLAAEVIREHPEITRIQRTLQFASLAVVASAEASSSNQRDDEKLHYTRVDVINLLGSIDEHTVNIAQVVLGII